MVDPIAEAHRAAVRAGLSPREFWGLTPWQFWECLTAVGERMLEDRKTDLWKAWHVAALARARKLPKLEMFVGIKRDADRDPKALAQSLKETLRGFKGRKAKR